MHYYRVLEGPTPLTHEGTTVEYFNLLLENKGIEERNAPVVGCEHDLSDKDRLATLKLMEAILVHFEDKAYDYRGQLQKKR